MTDKNVKPLFWEPQPGIGYTVKRRSDGGMNITFTDLNQKTLKHWREFALQHLLESDRQTRNLYDLRAVSDIPADAVNMAIEANNDPSARNIRLAVVVANEDVRKAVIRIASLTSSPGGGTTLQLFTDLDEAEAWLTRPLDTMV